MQSVGPSFDRSEEKSCLEEDGWFISNHSKINSKIAGSNWPFVKVNSLALLWNFPAALHFPLRGKSRSEYSNYSEEPELLVGCRRNTTSGAAAVFYGAYYSTVKSIWFQLIFIHGWISGRTVLTRLMPCASDSGYCSPRHSELAATCYAPLRN